MFSAHRPGIPSLVGFAAIVVAASVSLPAFGQEKFPARPIELVVPTPAGGGTDITMRLLAELAEPALGQKVVVVNKPGGAGTVGVAAVTSAKPDGYTLGAVYNAPLTMLPHLQSVPYTSADYIPVSLSNSAPLVLCAKKDFPANNGKEFIDYLKAHPNTVTYGGDGVGGTVQLAAERIFHAFGVKARLVPFQSAGETLKNFLGDQVAIYGGSFPPILPYLKEGSIKCLLVTSADRHFLVPDVMGTKDLGLTNVSTLVWAGVIAPKGTPPDRIAILEKAFADAAKSKAYKDRMAQLGTNADGTDAAEFKKLVDAESAAMKTIIDQLGLKKR
jgi:tripartite-type tricarboxylate transporter receptor subunit TctC